MTKLSVRLKNGKFELVAKEVPDPKEARRLWMEGKSAQYIMEQERRKKRSARD